MTILTKMEISEESLDRVTDVVSDEKYRALKKLVDDGTLIRIGAGRKTLYARADSVTK